MVRYVWWAWVVENKTIWCVLTHHFVLFSLLKQQIFMSSTIQCSLINRGGLELFGNQNCKICIGKKYFGPVQCVHVHISWWSAHTLGQNIQSDGVSIRYCMALRRFADSLEGTTATFPNWEGSRDVYNYSVDGSDVRMAFLKVGSKSIVWNF